MYIYITFNTHLIAIVKGGGDGKYRRDGKMNENLMYSQLERIEK